MSASVAANLYQIETSGPAPSAGSEKAKNSKNVLTPQIVLGGEGHAPSDGLPTTAIEQGPRKPKKNHHRRGRAIPLEIPTLDVWTDGSVSRNGLDSPRAGIGVWFHEEDLDNCSRKYFEGSQSIVRTELMAILIGLERACKKTAGPVNVHTDCQPAIACIKQWESSWSTAKKASAMNADLLEKIDQLRTSHSAPCCFCYVRAHCGIEGNVEANRLARRATH
eukprot:GHVT01069963.1.p1 GENE.GHVT01069963.1~~GHVT01069963.1.p1  ORF type:complete len:221 (-),score=15.09 GHVT01069963.1:1848-2510(-)